MTYIPPSNYVVGYLGGMKFFAKYECYGKIRRAMMNNECVEFIDVDGEPCTVNGFLIEGIFASTEQTRKDRHTFEETLKSNDEKEPWK